MAARLFFSSGDPIADHRFELARDLQLKGDLTGAADLVEQAAELAPKFASAWFTLGELRQQLGESERAVAAFRKARAADPDDRHGASVRLMRLGAEQLSAMPRGYVQALFDHYAPRFEAALLVGLRGQSDASTDLVIAADAFIYVSELAPVLTEVQRVLAPGGLLAFSVETHGGEGVVIGEGLRYAHAAEYVRNRTAASGLKLAYLEQASPRAEANEPVRGLVAVASKT